MVWMSQQGIWLVKAFSNTIAGAQHNECFIGHYSLGQIIFSGSVHDVWKWYPATHPFIDDNRAKATDSPAPEPEVDDGN